MGGLGCTGRPVGVMSNYVNEAPDKTGKTYLLHKILAGQTISVGLQRNNYTDKHYAQLSRLIANAYNDWFANAPAPPPGNNSSANRWINK